MKRNTTITASLLIMLMSIQAYAQDGLDIDVDLDGKDYPALFERPIFWIGVAIVILLLAVILKKKK